MVRISFTTIVLAIQKAAEAFSIAVLALSEPKVRVKVTADSNTAVDNLVKGVAKDSLPLSCRDTVTSCLNAALTQ